jgi:hypothetical protein
MRELKTKKNKNMKIKVGFIHLVISLVLPLIATGAFDLSSRLFNNAWEYFHFLTGMLGFFFFYIKTASVGFVLCTIILKLLIIYTLIILSLKNKKRAYFMYVINILISVATIFLGYYIMLIARL